MYRRRRRPADGRAVHASRHRPARRGQSLRTCRSWRRQRARISRTPHTLSRSHRPLRAPLSGFGHKCGLPGCNTNREANRSPASCRALQRREMVRTSLRTYIRGSPGTGASSRRRLLVSPAPHTIRSRSCSVSRRQAHSGSFRRLCRRPLPPSAANRPRNSDHRTSRSKPHRRTEHRRRSRLRQGRSRGMRRRWVSCLRPSRRNSRPCRRARMSLHCLP
jgi:hypothetical protein